MRSLKKTLVMMLAVLMVVTCAFAMTACKHKHEYTETVTAPTCNTDGFTTYTCECGDTYTDNVVPANGTDHDLVDVSAKAATCTEAGYSAHKACTRCSYTEGKTDIAALGHGYRTTITAYPTATEAGSRTVTCTNCDYSATETIEALSVRAPKAADMLKALIGDVKYTLSMSEDSTVKFVKELSDYVLADDAGETGYVRYVVFELAEIQLNGKADDLAGYIKLTATAYDAQLDALNADPTVYDDLSAFADNQKDTATVEIFVNGDVISLGGDIEGEDESLNELFYSSVGAMLGLDYETALVLGAYFEDLADIALVAEALAEELAALDYPTVTDAYIADLEALFAAVGADIITTDATVDGEITYALDFTALGAFADEIEGKTVAAYVEEIFGEDLVKSMLDFIKALPDTTVREIADTAITFSEEAGFDVNAFFEMINVIIYVATEEEIDVRAELEENYDLTIAQILVGDVDNADEQVAGFKEELNAMADAFYALTFDQLFNVIAYSDPDYTPEGASEAFSILAVIDQMLAAANDVLAISVTYTDDADAPEFLEATVTITIDGDRVTVNVTPESFTMTGIESVGTADEAVLFEESFTYAYDDATGVTTYAFSFELEGNEHIALDATVDADGVVDLDFVIRALYDLDHDNSTENTLVNVLEAELDVTADGVIDADLITYESDDHDNDPSTPDIMVQSGSAGLDFNGDNVLVFTVDGDTATFTYTEQTDPTDATIVTSRTLSIVVAEDGTTYVNAAITVSASGFTVYATDRDDDVILDVEYLVDEDGSFVSFNAEAYEHYYMGDDDGAVKVTELLFAMSIDEDALAFEVDGFAAELTALDNGLSLSIALEDYLQDSSKREVQLPDGEGGYYNADKYLTFIGTITLTVE